MRLVRTMRSQTAQICLERVLERPTRQLDELKRGREEVTGKGRPARETILECEWGGACRG